MNHQKTGLERIYDLYGLENEKAAWFLLWEREIVRLAQKVGVAETLEIPAAYLSSASRDHGSTWQPQRSQHTATISVRYSLPALRVGTTPR